MTFYHYTCDHGRKAIGDHGNLKSPGTVDLSLYRRTADEDQRLMYTLLWVTDLPEPDIEGLGLTSKILSCERWRHRYRVTNPLPVMPFSDIQYRFSPEAQLSLLTEKARPEHWFISWRPLPAVYDPIESAHALNLAAELDRLEREDPAVQAAAASLDAVGEDLKGRLPSSVVADIYDLERPGDGS